MGSDVVYKNKAKCKKCRDVVESKHRHDFVSCKCGAIAVDGGNSYWRCMGDLNDLERIWEPLEVLKNSIKKGK